MLCVGVGCAAQTAECQPWRWREQRRHDAAGALDDGFGHLCRPRQERAQRLQLGSARLALDRVRGDAGACLRRKQVELIFAQRVRIRAIEAVQRAAQRILQLLRSGIVPLEHAPACSWH